MNARPSSADIDFWRRTRQLYLDACTLPADERAAFLSAVEADEALITAVQRLLQQDEATGPVAAIPPSALAEAFVSALEHLEQNSASTQGEFRIERVLGEGGMGRVYLAVRTAGDVVQRVALKVVPMAISGPRLTEQLRRERAILAGLEHPHIARLVDTGELPDGRPFFAMEYVDGMPLLQYCNAARLDLRARLALFLRICEAVSYAHGQLVLHRDLKDSNILVDAAGHPRLLDFGIAKSLAEAGARDTTQGQNHFSLRAAAPEQIRGGATTVATDVYGLGCVLYELLCGQLPFDTADTDRSQLLHRILEQPPPLASAAAASATDSNAAQQRNLADARALAAALRGDLDAVIARALRKDPAERYPSADHLAADLRNVLAQRPIAERASERWYRARMALRRNRLTAMVAGVLGLAVIATTALSVAQSRRAAQERDRALAALQTAQLQRDHAQHVTDFLVGAFQSADRERLTRNLSAVKLLGNAAATLERDSSRLAPPLRATLAQTLSHLFFLLQNKSESIRLGELARREMAATADMPQEVRVRQFLVDAESAFSQNQFADAIKAAQDGLQLAGDSARYSDGEVLPMLWEIKLRALLGVGRNAETIQTADTALAELSRRTDLHPERLDWIRLQRGRAHYAAGQSVAYQEQLLQLLDEQRQQGRIGASHIRALADLAHAYKINGDYEKSLAVYEETLTKQRASYGEDHPLTPRLLYAMAGSYIGAGRRFEGMQLQHRLIAVSGRYFDPQEPFTVNVHFYLGENYIIDLSDAKSAEYFVRKAMAMSPPEADGNLMIYERRLALILTLQERWFEAAYHADHAADALRAKYGQIGDAVEGAAVNAAYVALRRFDTAAARARLSGWLLLRARNRTAENASTANYYGEEAREAEVLGSVFGWTRDDGSVIASPLRW